MPLSSDQQAEIDQARAGAQPTLRPVAPALEEILYQALPVLDHGFVEHLRDSAQHLREGLSRLANRYGHGELRGQGLLWGLTLSDDCAEAVVKAALQLQSLIADELREPMQACTNTTRDKLQSVLCSLGA